MSKWYIHVAYIPDAPVEDGCGMVEMVSRRWSSAVRWMPGAGFALAMEADVTLLNHTKDNPWQLKTPPGTSAYTMHVEERDGKPVLVCTVGSTVLSYDARCVEDLHAMLTGVGDWVELGGADEHKPAKEGTFESWGRSPTNPVGGWYGLKKGLRGRFGVYVPPLMEALGLCELEHNPKNNRMRATSP